MRCVVLGAGGFLGLNLVDSLHDAGVPFRCGSRRPCPRIALRKRNVEICHADLDQPDTLDAALRGADVVLHVAGHYPALSLDPVRTMELGLRQMRTLLDAAARQQIRRVVYVSSTATAAPAEHRLTREQDVYQVPPDGLYHRLKWAMEQEALQEDRLEVVIACPGACLGPWDQRIGTSAPLVALAHGQRPALPDGILNLVDVRDVASALVQLAVRATIPQRVLLVGHNLDLFSFLKAQAERYGVEGPRRLTALAARSFAVREERRAQTHGRRPRLSVELVDLLVHSVPIDATLSIGTLGIRYRDVEQTLESFERWTRKRRILPRHLEASP